MKVLKNETLLRVVLALACCAGALGCSTELADTQAQAVGGLAVPPRLGFELVSDAMQLHCGTLDCHGQIGRNMRLYGMYGLRLGPHDDPLNEPTSPAEYDADYWSIVGLEPEAVARVVEHQAGPEALSMIRKARGIERHKGGQLVTAGDVLDRVERFVWSFPEVEVIGAERHWLGDA